MYVLFPNILHLPLDFQQYWQTNMNLTANQNFKCTFPQNLIFRVWMGSFLSAGQAAADHDNILHSIS